METKLLEQLENNSTALTALDERIFNIKTAKFYSVFCKEAERQEKIEWTLKVKRRVLKMRFTLLENLKYQTNNELRETSKKLRKVA